MAVSGIDATYYTTANLERAVEFYRALLGGEPTTLVPGRVAEWVLGDQSAFGLYCMPNYEGDSCGSVMFAVSDVVNAMTQAKERGVRFDGDDITKTPECEMAFGRDPDGNQFILHRRR